MSVTIRKAGFDVAGLSRRVRSAIAEDLNDSAQEGVTLAKQLAAVRTGEMRDKISQTEEATPDHLRVTVEAGADHSIFVEYGTVNMDAQPFMTPASELMRMRVSRFPKVITVLR